MRTYYSEEWDILSYAILTSDTEWIPSFIDSTESEDDEWFDYIPDP